MNVTIRQGVAAGLTALVLAACAADGEDPAEGSAGEEPAEPAAATTSPGTAADTAAAGTSYALVVSNPMPHAMIVSLAREQGAVELGAVPANSEQRLEVPASAGSTVTLIARDEAQTHSPTTTLTLPEGDGYAVWRIE